ncbi:MAG: DAK2 domain-containing protein [Coriobacteriia bacterium]|nr:DAK2 domain-containing protein [Coriobacteriia bacterium]
MTSDRHSIGTHLFIAAAAALKERAEEVNRLNVFPVPDGDTGTNMTLTLDAVLADVSRLPADASIADVCHAITHGSLMGARGNSGVILSQMLRGLCEVCAESTEFSTELVAAALERSTTVAFQAVRKPVEGTMLTVLKDAASAARAAVNAGLSLEEALNAIVQAAFESVRHGPELLPVLKENGVVDAGGFGLAILGEGFVSAFEGHEYREHSVATAAAPLNVVPVDDWNDEEYLYCTEFLLHGAEADKSVIEEYISERGGSELVVGDQETYKIHVHTDEPGIVLAWATGLGEVSEVHVNNMRRQTAHRTETLRSESATPAKPVGFVAVAAGSGMAEILESLGADVVVSGGQTMNPSTAELLEAVRRVSAESVVILPNNRNIIMAAQQVIELADRPVAVVPTTAVPQAFAALLAYDGSTNLESIARQMTDAAATVRTAEVTTAIKDSKGKVGPIKSGQVIGIVEHEIEAVGWDIADVTCEAARVITDGGETMTVLAGEQLSDEELDALVKRLSDEYPDIEVEGHRGEQPLYPVILSVE